MWKGTRESERVQICEGRWLYTRTNVLESRDWTVVTNVLIHAEQSLDMHGVPFTGIRKTFKGWNHPQTIPNIPRLTVHWKWFLGGAVRAKWLYKVS